MNKAQLYTDKELFYLISEGDEEAFANLFRKYDRRIYPFVLKIIRTQALAEEITQDVFMKIWNNKDKLADVDQPEAYILTIAARHTLDQIRKRLNEKKMLQRLSEEIGDISDNSIIESMDLRDRTALLKEAIEGLTGQQKRVFSLSREEHLNYHEIGQRMSLSSNTVRNHLVEALKSVRAYMEGHNDVTLSLYMCILLMLPQ